MYFGTAQTVFSEPKRRLANRLMLVSGGLGELLSGLLGAGRAYIYDLETGEELWTLEADPPLSGGSFGGSVALTESYALVVTPS